MFSIWLFSFRSPVHCHINADFLLIHFDSYQIFFFRRRFSIVATHFENISHFEKKNQSALN